ncbi:unnamed protein product [Cylicocyclus nassatus]|uniref:Uncharacterized protein n=1 Tax=Cylicocyclus nassatus TaxID=53992 RepID=A0AA36GEX7_CYLNA|nr:unnamed protein product [Cylicocyclus nassatus]
MMLKILTILAVLPYTTSTITCRTYSPEKKSKEIEKTKSLYCAFIMTERCDEGYYTEGPAWNAQAMSNHCSIKNGIFSCSCNTELCSSDHNYLMKLWKRSPQYSANNKYTICLQKLIEKDLENDYDYYVAEERKAHERIKGKMSEDDDRDNLGETEEQQPKRREKLASGYVCAVILAVVLAHAVF